MKYYDRQTKQVVSEKEYGKKRLEFLYHSAGGRFLLKFISMTIFSDLVRIYKDSAFSKKSIKSFVQRYGLSCDEQELSNYKSFNDFFTRRRTVSFSEDPNVLTAVADSKLSVYPIQSELRMNIKNSTYSIAEILDDPCLSERFSGGCCLIFRLSVEDIHHYFYFDDGETLIHKSIAGRLHTIRPISEKYRVFAKNKREVTIMQTKHFGLAAQIEVGALLVGRIVNQAASEFKRGDEKGYFEYGGSTIVVLLEKMPQMDKDILSANNKGLEVRVLAGERIGTQC